ncbi:MAG: DUF935 family protein [Rikenellaceae bacterium]
MKRRTPYKRRNQVVTLKNREAKLVHQAVAREVPRGRQDISNWTNALNMAQSVTNPMPYRLYQLYDNVLLDTVLSNQMDLRIVDVTGGKIYFLRDGVVDTDATEQITNKEWFLTLNRKVLESIFYKFSLVELSIDNDELIVDSLPRINIIHSTGKFLPDIYASKSIMYRELTEYGTTLLEFTDANSAPFGLLNKMIPHALIKRFAQGCWGEYGEIAGIPTRVFKTDTENPNALNRLEAMMKDIGSSPYAIIDESETIEWANNHSSHNGDVFGSLISVCDGQMAIGIRGAITGQDTKNGNYSKEEVGIEIAQKLTNEDKQMLTIAWNSQIIPALERLGIIPMGLQFAFQETVNLSELFGRVKELLPYKQIDNEWIEDTFGIPVTDKVVATTQEPTSKQLHVSDFFA